MFYLSEKEFRSKMRKIRLKNEEVVRRQELKKERNKYKPTKKRVQTTKIITALLMIFLLVNCIAIEIYSCWVMFSLQDISALYVLIGAACTTVIGEVLAYTIYAIKSFRETKAEKELEFEYRKLELQEQICSNDETVG